MKQAAASETMATQSQNTGSGSTRELRENPLASALHQRFLESPQYAKLLARTARHSQSELNLAGLSDSAKSLVLSVLNYEVKRPFFIIVQDNQVASRIKHELSNLSRYPVYFYPSSEVSPYEQVLSSPDNVAPQLEVLNRIIQGGDDPYMVIVPIRALIQRVLDKETLQEKSFVLKRGESVDREDLARKLAALGYSREALVTLRGEFSIRGDIIDIYPSSGYPIRIELFDDEVESIRQFNIDNQRSVDELSQATIPPRFWIVLDDTKEVKDELINKLRLAAETTAEKLDEGARETLLSIIENDLTGFASGQYPESCEYYFPFVSDRFATLADYLPEKSLLFFDEWDLLSSSLLGYEEKLNAALNEGVSTGRLLALPRPLHASFEELKGHFVKQQKVYLSSLPAFPDDAEHSVVAFDCHPVERFGNQMQAVVDKVRSLRRNEHQVVISTEQPQRILGLLREWDTPARYLGAESDIKHHEAVSTDSATSATGGNLNTSESGGVSFSEMVARGKAPGAGSEVWVTRHGFVQGFRMDDIMLASITDAEMFGLKRRPTVYRRQVAEKTYERFTSVADLKVGDYVVHMKHGIGQFVGVQRIAVDNQQREFLTVQYSGEDRLYVPVDQINLLSRYRGAGDSTPRLSRLGGAEWETTKKRVKKSVKAVAEDLVNLYAIRAKQEGFMCVPDTPWQYEMEEAFPYEETPDQWQAILDMKKDLEANKPMDRLICGDVGFGKTEVAIRGVFKTVMSGKQVAVLVPTTILAQQHYNNICERFSAYPIRVGLLSRFRTAKEQREVIQKLGVGECDVVVGTHRMLQKDITFKDLGLLIIDEEQRFGVGHKEKLKQLRVMVDVLTMSATPIPRTLHMALTGARDMSLIHTPPVNRLPIKTFVGEYKLPLVRTAILHEMERGGQVYFVHNRIESIEQIAFELKQLVPEARLIIGHGQMSERDLENVMLDFAAHQYDVLVCTTIIESGLDIPNTNTIIVNEADKFGLAQLYQLRGRVGRSDLQAYAYCLCRPQKVLTETAQSRLKAIREFTSLGSGYQIALRDMEIRGVGNILGQEQHGHMISVGFELYCKLLEESVAELKGQSVASDADAQIDINVTAFIPETYIPDADQRLIEYKRLADVKSDRDLSILKEEWKDRFGKAPEEVESLAKVVRLRLLCARAQVSAIKPDGMSLKLSVSFRLNEWMPVQSRLPKHLASRTTYKPGQAGGIGPSPCILVRSQGLAPTEQLDLLEELLGAMVLTSAAPAK